MAIYNFSFRSAGGGWGRDHMAYAWSTFVSYPESMQAKIKVILDHKSCRFPWCTDIWVQIPDQYEQSCPLEKLCMHLTSYIDAETVKKSWKGAEKYNKLVCCSSFVPRCFCSATLKNSLGLNLFVLCVFNSQKPLYF